MYLQSTSHSRALEPLKETFPISSTYFETQEKEIIKSDVDSKLSILRHIKGSQDKGLIAVPTSKIGGNKELVVGFVAIFILIFLMFMFGFSLYIGSKQYKKYLMSREISEWGDLELENGLNVMTGFNTCKEEKSLISPHKLGTIRETNIPGDDEIKTDIKSGKNEELETDSTIYSTDNEREENNEDNEVEQGEEPYDEDSKTEREVNEAIWNSNEFSNYKYTPRLRINSPEKDHIKINLETGNDSVFVIKSALSALIDYTEVEPIDIIEELDDKYGSSQYALHHGSDEKEDLLPPRKVRTTYSKSEMVRCEPSELYNLIEYTDDDVLLVTDLIFPEISIMNSNNLIELEREYNKMRFCLGNACYDDVTKKIELIKFVNSSLGMKKLNNPKIFLFSYGLLIDKIIDDNCLKLISKMTKFNQMAIIEVIIKYCLNCWKYELNKNVEIESLFKRNNITPYIPNKLKIFKLVSALLMTGYRTKLLEQVLLFFTTPPTPCGICLTLDEVLINPTLLSDKKDLIKFLKRQVEDEHKRCCPATNDHDHWKYSSAKLSPIYESPRYTSPKLSFFQTIDSTKGLETIQANDDRLPGSLSSSPKVNDGTFF